MLITCAAPDCSVQFPYKKYGNQEQKYCSSTCKSRIRSRYERANRTPERNAKYDIAIKCWRQTTHGRFIKLTTTAKSRSIKVSITEEQYALIVGSGLCFYCGDSLFDGISFRTCVDRYDYKVGYTFDNCKACCWRCNEIKGSLERWFSPERSVELLKECIGE